MSSLVSLEFPNVQNLQDSFPTDPDSNITLILRSKKENYRLRKEILMKESQYFRDFFGNEKNTDAHMKLISNRYDPLVFDSIMKCFYGYKYLITKDSDVYSAYQIVQHLQIDLFLRVIENSMYENFQKYGFILLFQLSDSFGIEIIKEKCLEYAKENPQIFKQMIDMQKMEMFCVRGPQLLLQIERPPENILMLGEESFKQLIALHNQLKEQSFLDIFFTYEEIYKLLKYYVKIRIQNNVEERKKKLRQLVVQSIDPNHLTSKQYRLIYGSELLVQKNNYLNDQQTQRIDDQDSFFFIQSSEFQNLDPNQSAKQYFDPLQSQNVYLKKLLQERNEENAQLKMEKKTLIEDLEQKNRKIFQLQQENQYKFENLSKNLEERITMLTQLLQNSRGIIQKQQQSKYQQSQYTQPSMIQQYSASDSIVLSNIEYKEITQTKCQQQDNSVNLSFQSKRMNFDSTPQCVVESKELHYLLDILQIDIFQQLQLKLKYRGTQNMFSPSQSNLINQDDKLLYLIRTVDSERTFGYYNDSEETYILDVSNQKYYNSKKNFIQWGDGSLIKFGEEIIIKEDCSNHQDNLCAEMQGIGFIAGSHKFQVDELEIYQIIKTNAMI